MKGGGWEWSARASEFNLLWPLLEDWWPGILEAAGLAGWVAGGQGSTGQKVWLLSTPIFDLIEYTIELGRP